MSAERQGTVSTGRIYILAAVVIACVLAAGIPFGEWVVSFAEHNAGIVLPPDLALTPPGSDVPQDAAAFAGLWAGDRWDGVVPHALAVERVDADGTAALVYASGADKAAHSIHRFLRLTGRISDGHLRFRLPGGNDVDYHIAADGRLAGRSTTPNYWRSHVLLRRITGPDLADIVAQASRLPRPLWHEIDIPEQSRTAGSALTLRTTLYPTALAGKQPLLIIAHGSLDSDIAAESETLRYEDQARLFLALGYSVAVPMRKGRGGSAGALLEGTFDSGPPGPQIASGIEDLDAAITYFAAQPYVDPARIVIVGTEHGGLLAVAYAGRHPGTVAGIVNVSGEWWPETYRDGSINTEEFAAAGRTARCPVMFLYAVSRNGPGLAHLERNLAAFRAGGGTARLAVVPEPGGIIAYGTRLFDWPARWEDVVAAFLGDLAHPAPGAE